jgi:hypothetical protein
VVHKAGDSIKEIYVSFVFLKSYLSYLVLPGCGPAADPLLLWQKGAKPISQSPAVLSGMDAKKGKPGQLAVLRQGPMDFRGVHPKSLVAGVDWRKI